MEFYFGCFDGFIFKIELLCSVMLISFFFNVDFYDF